MNMANNIIETDKTFLFAALKERFYFQNFHNQKNDFRIIKFSQFNNKSSKWDVSLYSAGTYYIAEIKCRKYNSFNYPDWIIDESKWSDLNKIRNKYPKDCNVKLLYINIFLDNKLAIWQLDDINKDELLFQERIGRKKTCGNDDTFTNHKEFLLPNSLCTFYKFKIPSFQEEQEFINNINTR